MLYPTIEELTKGQHNRYELALATAKCARLITNEYVHQHELAEKAASKESAPAIDRELRDEKAVKVAINRMHRGEYSIVSNVNEALAEKTEEEAEPAADAE